MLGTIPTVPVVVDLMDLTPVAVADAVQRRHARVGPDRLARVECLDVTNFGEYLELDGSLGHRLTTGGALEGAMRWSSSVKVGIRPPPLKLEMPRAGVLSLAVTPAYD